MSRRSATKTRRRPGRPTLLLAPGVRDRLLEAFEKGASVEGACAYAGIGSSAFYNWMNRASDEIERIIDLHNTLPVGSPMPEPRPEALPYVEFVECVSRVRAERQIRMLEIIDKAAKGGYLRSETQEHTENGGYVVRRTYADVDWKAAQWWLERTFPNQFSRSVEGGTHSTLEVTGKGGGPIEVTSSVTINALSSRLRESYVRQGEDHRREIEAAPTLTEDDEGESPVDVEIVEEEGERP